MTNQEVAHRLLAYAKELEHRDANLFRVRAYRQSAAAVAAYPQPVEVILATQGRRGLAAIKGVGAHISYTLEGLLRTGELHTLRGDNGVVTLDHILLSVPGVGTELARRLREDLHINTLEELDVAARDGRLQAVGVGPKRLRGIQDVLAVRLGRVPRSRPVVGEPDVETLLEIDAEFRNLIGRRGHGTEKPPGPRRKRMLVMQRGGWNFRAVFANTALAHRLGATRDWVVIDFAKDRHAGQRTVVTESRGADNGRRVVRGREDECEALRDDAASATVPGHDPLPAHPLCAAVCPVECGAGVGDSSATD
jgi:hypothetical protein